VHDGSVVDLFVDADGVVHGGRLDGLALDHGLDCIVSYWSVTLGGSAAALEWCRGMEGLERGVDTYWSRGCGGARAPV
jgi:hypothetical protein